MASSFSLCATCGVEHALPLPDVCAICADERQYLPEDGVQKWTTLADLQRDRSMDSWQIEPGLYGLTTTPPVGIGHRPILVQTAEGNLLWDPPGYIDDRAVERVRSLGGIRWIVASHPHMFGVQLEWSAAFDHAPVYVNARDQEWIARHGDAIRLWDGTLELTDALSVIRVGGHFPGSSVVHWTGSDGKGVLLGSDTILPVAARNRVTFLRSYPNRLPLSGGTIRRIADQTLALDFDRIYGNFPTPVVKENAHLAVKESAELYIAWVSGANDHLT